MSTTMLRPSRTAAQGKKCARISQFSPDAIGEKLQGRADVTNKLRLREINFLDSRR
jgi:hypothetical protein